jgi:hypothetical protein
MLMSVLKVIMLNPVPKPMSAAWARKAVVGMRPMSAFSRRRIRREMKVGGGRLFVSLLGMREGEGGGGSVEGPRRVRVRRWVWVRKEGVKEEEEEEGEEEGGVLWWRGDHGSRRWEAGKGIRKARTTCTVNEERARRRRVLGMMGVWGRPAGLLLLVPHLLLGSDGDGGGDSDGDGDTAAMVIYVCVFMCAYM